MTNYCGCTKQERLAGVTATFAMAKIAVLQEAYLGKNNARSAWARAELAKLRRLNSQMDTNWISVGGELFDKWPSTELAELDASKWDEERVANTLVAAFGLYAMHQQSSKSECAFVRRDGETDEECAHRRRQASFGRCCRNIEPDLDEAAGVQRRLRYIEASAEFDGVLYGLRGLVSLIKSTAETPRCLDYYALTRDLYLLQAGQWSRDKVFSNWSKDYFAPLI